VSQSPPVSRRRPPRRRRRAVVRWLLVALAAALLFAVGIATGEALRDNPTPGGTQRLVRTLKPLALVPAARTTVTVTVTSRR
jgi:hypothetical protein